MSAADSQSKVSFSPYRSLHRAGRLQGKRDCTGLPQPSQPCPLNTGGSTPLSTVVHPRLLLHGTSALLTHSRRDHKRIRSRLSLPPKHLLSYCCELFRMKQFTFWPNREGSCSWKRETWRSQQSDSLHRAKPPRYLERTRSSPILEPLLLQP